jgi:hypothetical protein
MKKEGGTKVGNFLRSIKGVAPDVLNLAGNITGIDALKGLANAIEGSDSITPQDKETALKLLEMDLAEMQEVTKRWEADMASDSWLSKNVRPMVLIYLILVLSVTIILDGVDSIGFNLNTGYINLMETLLITIVVAYFGSRGAEKVMTIRNNKK